MLPFVLSRAATEPLEVLCLGAHADDIEIGCGGTLMALLESRANVHVTWVVFSGAGEREREARESAALFLRHAAQQTVITRTFRDGFFPYLGAEIKEFFQALKSECAEPDLIFTHYREDRHQDHRTLSELTWNTWRRNTILEYEIPKYDGDLGSPNFFVPLSDEIGRRKARHICEVFGSEKHKAWMTEDTFEALLRLRGVECAAPQKWAEAFYCRKLVLSMKN